MADLWKELLTLYGPLGLGWLLALWLLVQWRADVKESRRTLIEVVNKNTEAHIAFKVLLEMMARK